MNYCLNPGVNPEDALKEVFTGQIRYAIDSLQAYPEEETEGLHYARRGIKKLRSLLRLLPKSNLRDIRIKLNGELRLTARHLSVHRDREVLAGILDQWQKTTPETSNPHLASGLVKLLTYFSPEGEIHAALEPTLKASVIRRLTRTEDKFQSADLGAIEWSDLRKTAGTRKLKMERSHQDYLLHPNLESLHEWRKQLKNHLFQLLLLEQVDPAPGDELIRIKLLEKQLGNVRDLDLLLEHLREKDTTPLSVTELGEVFAYAEAEKVKILNSVLQSAL